MDFKEFKEIDLNDSNLIENITWKVNKEKKTLKRIMKKAIHVDSSPCLSPSIKSWDMRPSIRDWVKKLRESVDDVLQLLKLEKSGDLSQSKSWIQLDYENSWAEPNFIKQGHWKGSS